MPARAVGEVRVVHGAAKAQPAKPGGEARLLAHGCRHLHRENVLDRRFQVGVECHSVLLPLLEWGGAHVVCRSHDAEAHAQQVDRRLGVFKCLEALQHWQ